MENEGGFSALREEEIEYIDDVISEYMDSVPKDNLTLKTENDTIENGEKNAEVIGANAISGKSVDSVNIGVSKLFKFDFGDVGKEKKVKENKTSWWQRFYKRLPVKKIMIVLGLSVVAISALMLSKFCKNKGASFFKFF